MTLSPRAFLLALAVVALVPRASFAQPAPAPPASATPATSEADSHFRRGVDLYKEGDFSAALIEFRRAYELDPRFQALYNIGETYYQLQDYADALRTLDKYLRDGGALIPAARREEVTQEIAKLKTRVALLEVVVSARDVEIAVDDVPIGRTPLTAPLLVSAGRRRITATRAGKPPITQIIELAGGDAKKLSFALPDEAEAPASRVEVTPPPRSVPIAPWVVTGVLGASGIATGILALGASGDLKDKLASFPGNQDDIKKAHDKTFAFALATDVLVGATVVMAAVSIYFTAASAKSERPATATLVSPFAPPPAGAGVRIEAGPRSVALSGTF